MPYSPLGAIVLTILTSLWVLTPSLKQPLNAETSVNSVSKSNAKSLSMTPQGIGKLSAKTELSEAVLRNALPGYQFKKATRGSKSDPYEVFEYYRQNKLAVEVYPDASKRRILSIIVFDNTIATPKNTRVGMSYRNVTQGQTGIACLPGAEAASKQVICVFKDARMMKYVFAPSNWKGSSDGMPPTDVLNQAPLIKIAIVFR